MSDLIQRLNALATLTPDEIAAQIGDPFRKWAQADILTPDMLVQYGETPIVICHQSYRNRPADRAERHHHLSWSDPEVGNTRWAWEDWSGSGVLRPNGSFWFRSKRSFEDNPDETF